MRPPPRIAKPLCGLIFAAAVLAPALAHACQIPVFRYALERWQAAPYEVVVFHRGPLSPADQSVIDGIGGANEARANVSAAVIDLSQKLDKDTQALWDGQSAKGEPPLPWVVVRYPNEMDSKLLWSEKLDAAPIRVLVDSPARREVAGRLIKGQSAVWVLVDSGDKAKDDAAAVLLAEQLTKLEKELVLPDQDPNEPGPRIMSELPLKLQFSMVRVSRSDEAEKPFVTMLTHTLKPTEQGEPAVIPVFGQGRALCTLVGKEIEPKQLNDIASFLIGECSCQVKELNPGFDLMMAADWRSIVEGRDAEPPPLAADEPAKVPATRPTTKPIAPAVARAAGPATQPTTIEPAYVAAASLAPVQGAATFEQVIELRVTAHQSRGLLIAATTVMALLVVVLGGLALRSRSKRGGPR